MNDPAEAIPRFRCRTVKLGKHRDRADRGGLGDHCYWINLNRAPAFAANPRGILLHRTRRVSVYILRGEISHCHVDHLCGNGFNVDFRLIKEVLAADPPKERLLCLSCEARATARRLPGSDELAGRHVHRGVLVPTQVCCK